MAAALLLVVDLNVADDGAASMPRPPAALTWRDHEEAFCEHVSGSFAELCSNWLAVPSSPGMATDVSIAVCHNNGLTVLCDDVDIRQLMRVHKSLHQLLSFCSARQPAVDQTATGSARLDPGDGCLSTVSSRARARTHACAHV
jgi:hypothetical protein